MEAQGPTIALEVSSTLDPARQSLWASLDRRYDRPVPGLQGDWIVQFTPGTQLKKVADPLTALLLRQEQVDLDKIGLNGWDDSTPPGELHTPQHAADLQELAALNVMSAQRVRSDKASGRIFPTEANAGVARSTFDTISPYIDEFFDSAPGQNKVKKLANHPDREGHLFVWADRGHVNITVALAQGFVPAGSPSVPSGLHTTWLGSFDVDRCTAGAAPAGRYRR
ncbi:hypothetical protein ACFTWD_37350 [Streptomyces sp. NPDC056943]|uniref:hypothetical protein n=1 Tax=Streptomyces sp. NPDC056943 TaxID=3345971 RepID=UPI00363F85D7